MSQIVIFKQMNGKIAILVPTQEALQIATLEQISIKDVPTGCPYWIVDSKNLPNTPQETWDIDEQQYPPHGYGGESNEFPTEIIAKYKELCNDTD